MRVVFDILGAILFLAALGSCAIGGGTLNQIAGITLLCASAIFLVGGALLKEAQDIKQRLDRPEK